MTPTGDAIKEVVKINCLVNKTVANALREIDNNPSYSKGSIPLVLQGIAEMTIRMLGVFIKHASSSIREDQKQLATSIINDSLMEIQAVVNTAIENNNKNIRKQ